MTKDRDDAPNPVRGVLRFSSGASKHTAKRAFMSAFNRRDYTEAALTLETRRNDFTSFQYATLNGLLAVERSDWEHAERAFQKADGHAHSQMDHAVGFENWSYLRIKQGHWEEARALCIRGIEECGTVEGLYVNLLAALDHLGANDEVRAVLEVLPAIFSLQHGALRLHLLHDPDLDGIRHHPSFEHLRTMLYPEAQKGGSSVT